MDGCQWMSSPACAQTWYSGISVSSSVISVSSVKHSSMLLPEVVGMAPRVPTQKLLPTHTQRHGGEAPIRL